jgi:hypothetical protein
LHVRAATRGVWASPDIEQQESSNYRTASPDAGRSSILSSMAYVFAIADDIPVLRWN